jgi:predicted hydrolase (HD superfamily)
MKVNKHIQSFGLFKENLNISDVMNSYIKQISNDFTKVADKYDLVKVDDTLDYEGEFSEDLEDNIYSVNIWIKDENLSPSMRKAENQRIVVCIMFLNLIDI